MQSARRLEPARGGETTVRAKLIVDQRPANLAIRDISLVVKK